MVISITRLFRFKDTLVDRNVAIVMLLLAWPSAGHAQVSEMDRVAVASELRVLSESLSASNLPDLVTAKRNVVQAHDNLNVYLSQHATPENWAAWLQYLDLDALIEAASSESGRVS